jgi:hypothetical protein
MKQQGYEVKDGKLFFAGRFVGPHMNEEQREELIARHQRNRQQRVVKAAKDEPKPGKDKGTPEQQEKRAQEKREKIDLLGEVFSGDDGYLVADKFYAKGIFDGTQLDAALTYIDWYMKATKQDMSAMDYTRERTGKSRPTDIQFLSRIDAASFLTLTMHQIREIDEARYPMARYTDIIHLICGGNGINHCARLFRNNASRDMRPLVQSAFYALAEAMKRTREMRAEKAKAQQRAFGITVPD